MMSNLFPEYLPLPQLQKVMNTLLLMSSDQVPSETTPYSHSLSYSSVITTISASSIQTSPESGLYKEIGLTPVAQSLSRCPSCSGWLTSPCKCHPYNVFPSFPHCSMPLHHHSQPGGSLSGLAGVSHRWILRYAQAVEPGASICCPVQPLMAHLQGSGFSNHALSGCSKLQPHFVRLQLTSKVNLR